MNRNFLANILELLTERSRSDDPQNNQMFLIYYDLAHLCKDTPEEEKTDLYNRIMKQVAVNSRAMARWTWNFTNQNAKTKFFNNGDPNLNTIYVDPSDIKSYQDTLWYYKKNGVWGSYINAETGCIQTGHEDIVRRLNDKYGLSLDPAAKLLKLKKDDVNFPSFVKWCDNFFLPWYSTNYTKQGGSLVNEYLANEKRTKEEMEADLASKDMSVKPAEVVQPEPKEEKPVDNSLLGDRAGLVANLLFFQGAEQALKGFVVKEREKGLDPQTIYNELKEILIACENNDKKPVREKAPAVKEYLKKFASTHNLKESKECQMNKESTMLKEANVFSSINTDETPFDPSRTTSNVFDNNEPGGISQEKEQEKQRLTAKVLDKLNQTLAMNKEVQNILDEIREINNENNYNIWTVNEEGNTARLDSKNAKIFKQNMNLCLSHDDNIEIFKSVAELHDWLRQNNYPLPRNIKLHESSLTEKKVGDFWYSDDDPRARYNGLGKWIEILNLDLLGKSEKIYNKEIAKRNEEVRNFGKKTSENEMGECVGGACTTTASLGAATQYLAQKKEESLSKGDFVSKLKSLQEDEMGDATGSLDSTVQGSAGFGGSSSGSSAETSLSNELDAIDGTSQAQDDTVDLGQDGASSGKSEFDINVGGYGPSGGDSGEEEAPAPMIPQPDYKIIDVLSDNKGNVKVKVLDTETNKTEYKDLSEIDI